MICMTIKFEFSIELLSNRGDTHVYFINLNLVRSSQFIPFVFLGKNLSNYCKKFPLTTITKCNITFKFFSYVFLMDSSRNHFFPDALK